MSRWRKNSTIRGVYRPGLAALGVASLAILILELALPIVTMQIYDRVLPNEAKATLTLLLGLAAAALVLEALIRLARARLVAFSGYSMTHSLGQELIVSALQTPGGRVGSEAVGKQMQTMASVSSLRDFHSGHATVTILELGLIPVLIGTIALIAGWVALVPLGFLLMFVFVLRRRSRSLLAALEKRNASDETRYDYIIETIGEIHSVKALALEPYLARNYESLKGRSTDDGYMASLRLLALFDVSALFSSLITLGTITAGAAAVLKGELTAGGLIACILLAGRVMQPVRRALALQAQRQEYQIASDRVDAMLAASAKPVKRGASGGVENNGHLEVEALTLRFRDAPPVIEDVNLVAKPGDVIVIDGPTDSGKSAFLRAVAGDLVPAEGEVRVGGAPVLSLDASIRNGLVGYLAAEGEIYRGTILDNLTRFGETAFADAMYLAQLLDFEADIAHLPAGMETRLDGTGSDPIPPGLKLRIAFGRSLSPRPKLILFDSADAGLDRTSYQALYTLFCRLKGKATILMVTEDDYLKSLATRRCEIVDGTLVERRLSEVQSVPVRRYREIRV